MREELDKQLVEKYPKLFVNRYKDMQETCMCWGFACGDGWFNIIDRLCDNIQHHIDWRQESHDSAVEYNKMVADMQSGDFASFDKYSEMYANSEYKETRRQEILKNGVRPVPELCPQVTVDQVKEKFGTLRFYYTGGDEYIRGLTSMAESMTAVTCEECGAPGERRGGGWVHTYCDVHEAEYQKRMEERFNGTE